MKTKTSQWSDEFYVKAYQLARAGATYVEIESTLGMGAGALKRWMKRKPALAKAIDSGKKQNVSLSEWIYKRLPGEYKTVWDRLLKMEKAKNSIDQIEMMLEQNGENCRKYLFLYALVNSHFNPSQACRKVNISLTRFRKWCQEDWAFAGMVAECHEHKKNLFEGKLIELVEEGNPKAILMVNRTINKDRGYGEKLLVEHSGQVNHAHVIELGEELLSQLSKPARRELMQVVEQMQIENKGNGHASDSDSSS